MRQKTAINLQIWFLLILTDIFDQIFLLVFQYNLISQWNLQV